MKFAPANSVGFLLGLIAIGACAFGSFLTEAPNRLTSGHPLVLIHVTDMPMLMVLIFCGIALLAGSFTPPTKQSTLSVLIIASTALLFLFFTAGRITAIGMATAPSATRISFGWAFWSAGACLAMLVFLALQKRSATMRFVTVAILAAALAFMARTGQFDGLSLMREYAARRSDFATELWRHCLLVIASVGIALALGVPLGVFVARRATAGKTIFGTLNILQTIPSVALFGLLIAPLSALGIGGIGMVPAVIALVLYALLPVVRNTQTGITGIDPFLIDAAAGMGLSPAQIFWRVELPLGMPIFLAGLRIVIVQTIGLAVIAALIGAGGLGSFVFEGIGEYAIDLVLLGAIPAILLALTADFILALVASLFERKRTA
jgi:osmoprotectant transport system permease protein